MPSTLRLDSPADLIGRQGNGIISFGSGQPDLPPPPEVFDGWDIRTDMRYGPVQGELALREALAQENPGSSPEQFVITNGASEALDLVFRQWGSGKVLVPRPYYYSYPPLIERAGMEPVYTDVVDGRIDFDDVRRKLPDCRVMLINSPSNPTGCVEDIATLQAIETLTAELGVAIVSDEVYKNLIYERENYPLHGDHVVTINSFSKTYALCGARVGYLWSSDPSIVENVCEMKTHTSMNTGLMAQDMALRAMQAPKEYVERQRDIWRQRRDFIYKGFCDLGFDLWRPEGAFYILPTCKNARAFLTLLYEEYDVITYLGEWFGAPDRLRLSYALDIEQIAEGLDRIADAMKRVEVV